MAWERHGVLPFSGGWLSQPLHLLAQFEALHLTQLTYQMKAVGHMDKMTATQRELLRWLEKDDG